AISETQTFGFWDQNEWDRACQAARHFSTSCQRIVKDEREHDLARSDGWRDTPTEAMEHADALQKAIGEAAAERNWQDRNMGEKAKAESANVEEEHFGHLGEIPAKPLPPKRRKNAAA